MGGVWFSRIRRPLGTQTSLFRYDFPTRLMKSINGFWVGQMSGLMTNTKEESFLMPKQRQIRNLCSRGPNSLWYIEFFTGRLYWRFLQECCEWPTSVMDSLLRLLSKLWILISPEWRLQKLTGSQGEEGNLTDTGCWTRGVPICTVILSDYLSNGPSSRDTFLFNISQVRSMDTRWPSVY